jgi:hypothetical protein
VSGGACHTVMDARLTVIGTAVGAKFWSAELHDDGADDQQGEARQTPNSRSLVDQMGMPNRDALVDILLAPLAPDIYRMQRSEHRLAKQDVVGALTTLAHRMLGD